MSVHFVGSVRGDKVGNLNCEGGMRSVVRKIDSIGSFDMFLWEMYSVDHGSGTVGMIEKCGRVGARVL